MTLRWEKLNVPSGNYTEDNEPGFSWYYSRASSPDGSTIAFASSHAGVIVTWDGGETWEITGTGVVADFIPYTVYAGNGILYLTTAVDGTGVWRLRKTDERWVKILSTQEPDQESFEWVYCSTNGQHVITASTNYGNDIRIVYYSHDWGYTWNTADTNNNYVLGVAVSDDGTTMAVTGQQAHYVGDHYEYELQIHISKDSGISWNVNYSFYEGDQVEGEVFDDVLYWILEMSANGNIIFATNEDMQYSLISTNGGLTFTKTLTGIPVEGASYSNGFDMTRDGVHVVVLGYTKGAYISHDSGLTWAAIHPVPLPPASQFWGWCGIVFVGDDPNEIMATNDYESAIYVSHNGGITWELFPIYEHLEIATDYDIACDSTGDLLIAGDCNYTRGWYMSYNGGLTFTQVYPFGEEGEYNAKRGSTAMSGNGQYIITMTNIGKQMISHSKDWGQTWETMSLTLSPGVAPRTAINYDGSIAVISLENMTFLLRNQGTSLKKILDYSVDDVAISDDGATILFTDYTNGVRLVKDGYISYPSPGGYGSGFVECACSANGMNMYVSHGFYGGIYEGNIYYTNNRGLTWNEIATRKNWMTVECSGDGKSIIASGDSTDYPRLYISQDYGENLFPQPYQYSAFTAAVNYSGSMLYYSEEHSYLYKGHPGTIKTISTALFTETVKKVSGVTQDELLAVSTQDK